MPAIIRGNEQRNVFVPKETLEYDYPDGLDLTPGSKLHNKIVTLVMDRAYQSWNHISTRFEQWEKLDESLTTYIEVKDSEKEVQDVDPSKPVSIVYPYSYAILDTLMSYMVAAFFQDPVFRYLRADEGSTIAAIMLEKVVQQHVEHFKHILALHTMLRDAFVYGFGAVAVSWKQEHGLMPKRKIFTRFDQFIQKFVPSKVEREFEETVLFEGNYLINIDPYMCLPDPNTPIHNVHDMEFFGWLEQSNLNKMLSEEKNDEELFNVRYLKQKQSFRSSFLNAGDKRDKKTGRSGRADSVVTSPVDKISMYCDIIPKEIGLGDSEYPEIWYFQVAADSIVVKTQPLGLAHGRIPVAIAAPDYDGYAKSPVSRIEMLYGMQHTLDWLFNTHIANVRKAINDMLIYDPYLLNSKDLKDPGPGKLVRTRRPAWGRGVENSIMQLRVTDVTQQHVADSSLLMQHMERIGGADSSAMGAVRQRGPERLTSSEFEGTETGKYSRLERIARIIGTQAFSDLGYIMASHTQQFMSKSTYFSIYGPHQEQLMKDYGKHIKNDMIRVSPYDLLIPYNVVTRDGTVPGGNFSKAWIQLFDRIAQTPELYQKFDIVRIFEHIARNLGAKNVQDFHRMDVSVVPDQQAQQMAQSGQVVPTQQVIGKAA
jgi:hypothetical protein